MGLPSLTTIGLIVGAASLTSCRNPSHPDATHTARPPLVVPAGWVATPPPTDTTGWYCANWSHDQWSVDTNSAGALRIMRDNAVRSVVYHTSGGFLQGLNRGEFGGELEWIDSAGTPPQILIKTNPIAFTPTSAGVFLWVEHMLDGLLLRVRRLDEHRWQVDTVVSLPTTPEAVATVDPTHFIVAGYWGVLAVDAGARTATWLHQNHQWILTYPSSMVVASDGRIFIGMRRAVVQLDPAASGYREIWLVSASCPRQRWVADGVPCGC